MNRLRENFRIGLLGKGIGGDRGVRAGDFVLEKERKEEGNMEGEEKKKKEEKEEEAEERGLSFLTSSSFFFFPELL